MKPEKWVWMPHPGHFICGSRCKFRMNTYVGGFIVSTVGEMPKSGTDEDARDWYTIGCDRLYETMVFKAVRSKDKCCPWQQQSGESIDMEGYNTPEDAFAGHMRLCRKWSKMPKNKGTFPE